MALIIQEVLLSRLPRPERRGSIFMYVGVPRKRSKIKDTGYVRLLTFRHDGDLVAARMHAAAGQAFRARGIRYTVPSASAQDDRLLYEPMALIYSRSLAEPLASTGKERKHLYVCWRSAKRSKIKDTGYVRVLTFRHDGDLVAARMHAAAGQAFRARGIRYTVPSASAREDRLLYEPMALIYSRSFAEPLASTGKERKHLYVCWRSAKAEQNQRYRICSRPLPKDFGIARDDYWGKEV